MSINQTIVEGMIAVGKSAGYWQRMATQMERERNEAFAERDASEARADRLAAALDALLGSGDGTYDNGNDFQNCIGCGDYYQEHGATATARSRDHAADCAWQAAVALRSGEPAGRGEG